MWCHSSSTPSPRHATKCCTKIVVLDTAICSVFKCKIKLIYVIQLIMKIYFLKEAGITLILILVFVMDATRLVTIITVITITMIKAITIILDFMEITQLTGQLMPKDIQSLQVRNNVWMISMEILVVIRTTSGIQAGIMLIRDKQIVSGSFCHLVDLQGCNSLWQLTNSF